jgi:DNA replication protein DnaC
MARTSEPTACACGGTGFTVALAERGVARAQRCACQEKCRRCGESGFVLVANRDTFVAQTCPCRHLDQRLGLFNAADIPAAYGDARFESFIPRTENQSSVKHMAEEFARRFRPGEVNRGLLFFGTPGCGKTHLLVSILRYLALEKGVATRYVEFMLLLSDIRAGFSQNRSHMEILRPLLSVPVLAIDELGKDRGTEWERSMLDELISRRYNSGQTTLFATNYPKDTQVVPVPSHPGKAIKTSSPDFQREAETMSLEERVGQRVYSRLGEMCLLLRVEGPDGRKVNEPERSVWRRRPTM